MKRIFSQIHRPTKRVFTFGWIIIILMLAVSTVFYIGAGEWFDYYKAVDVSEKLLAAVRPVTVFVCIGSLALEYSSKHKENLSE
ncbi:MAG: hypothetical protein E7547_06410 [Ruminococcaceae bacterium]|nr:hypothetical protein [Oscillospiraceae bacterium]